MIKNYCIVGTGSRAIEMFAKVIIHEYKDVARLTALCDSNSGRLEWANNLLGGDIPCYTDFEQMLDSVACDVVIVVSRDDTHDKYIIRAMERGKDVITEKPMTINDAKCRSILRAEKETGRNIKVTFNSRYAPFKAKIKELLLDGIVGDIHSVEFKWHLDTVHGADYFRRWHREKEKSGGLLVHKATHHFDLINWWLDLEPVQVAAMGSRQFYVPNRMPGHGERCLDCSVKSKCEFYFDVTSDEMLREMYFNNEKFDGYIRDQCVFSEEIDIEDTMSVIVRYPKEIQLTYALTAATPFEGWQVAFNGSKGRLEAVEPEAFISEEEQTDFSTRANIRRRIDWHTAETGDDKPLDSYQIRFYPLFGGVETYTVPYDGGGHGGGDERLRDHLFRGINSDKLGQMAGARAGAMSLLIGTAANKSIEENKFVAIADLL
ncbi:Gfo/Idh/MocA family protein [Lederbergia panacisoli]|uniref:Gfo/Idh/MocA family protein n=1 Tax=Lederbergia panacisoli TaxID=1255251 RepID=UPI00214CF8E2|nr:Gfo/Idh/MocA family oxidoreductase [Lederbergia panacisoli]MCR2821194.1 Gfo/Idh/MocA family oxidoreductase [Lederbergia panacisoli]